MTETATVEQTALEKAIAKGSVQGVLRAYLAQENREVSLDEFLKVLAGAGIEHEKTKVYSSLQALATNSKIDRGLAPNTYAPKGTVDQAAREAHKQAEREARLAAKATEPREKKAPGRPRKAPAETYTNEAVFTHLIEQLGDPREFKPGKTYGYAFVLLGDADGPHIIERYKLGFGSDPVAWTLSNVGSNPVVILHDK